MKRRSNPRTSANVPLYRQAFLRNVHILLYLGYARLEHRQFSQSSEPEISGALCEAIEEVLDDPASEDWVDDFEVHDDPPVHDPKRKGKHRRRVDIKLVSRLTRPRLRFCYEAKLLGRNSGVGNYVGIDGLGRFLDGSYAADQESGGMLGYVQSDDCGRWEEKLRASVDRRLHQLTSDGHWTAIKLVDHLSHMHRTRHSRARNLNPIAVYHTLLAFTV